MTQTSLQVSSPHQCHELLVSSQKVYIDKHVHVHISTVSCWCVRAGKHYKPAPQLFPVIRRL